MLTFLTWLWKPAQGYRSAFCAAHVNALARMIDRHYAGPHRVLCVTNMPENIDSRVGIVPDTCDFSELPSPHGGGNRNPSCYRRLRAFRPDAAQWFGERFVSMDLDTVIVGDLAPIVERPEPFVIWGETNPRSWYNGSLFLLTAGARPQVWTTFDPKKSPAAAFQAKRFGSDQGWISHCLGKGEATWSKADGVYSYRVHIAPKGDVLPKNARLVNWHGVVDPWSYRAQQIPWVREHYPMTVEA